MVSARPTLAQSCGNVQLQLAPDYSFAIGSSNGGYAYTFNLGGQMLAQGSMTQLALFHYDNALGSTSGIVPMQSSGTSFVPGKFGSAVAVGAGGGLSYPFANNLNLQTGTIEMWISPRFNGTDPVYAQYNHNLLLYSPNGSQFIVSENTARAFYAGVVINGKFTGAGGGSIAGWQAGEWHHLAFTYSSGPSGSARERLFLDGILVTENDSAMPSPGSDASTFTVYTSPGGNASGFVVDELRISGAEESPAGIQFDATRSRAFLDNEVYFSLAGVSPGQLTYSVGGCGTASLAYTGIPITNFSPPSGLLPPGSTSVLVSFQTVSPTVCRYSVGSNEDYNSMQPLETGPASTMHQGSVSGISTDTRVLSPVYIRCASNPDFLQSTVYRTVATPSGGFPRIGSIWGGEHIYKTKPEQAKKIQLFLGANMTPVEAAAVRAANPDVLILPSIQLDDTWDYSLPESYYLHDVNGKRYSDWCSVPTPYVLNMTRPEVAAYVGQQAYQTLAQSNWAFDGIFFDSFSTYKPVSTTDCYGNPIQISSQNNGLQDDQAALSAAWAAGEYLAVTTYRKLVPGGYVSGHVGETPAQAASLAAFNGTSIVFDAVNVREGVMPFDTLWNLYQTWEAVAVSPVMTMVQSSPPNQLAYGFGYDPLAGLLPSTANFGQTFYPNMRFGLGLALMNNGFFTHDFGDNNAVFSLAWWYDEYDFSLGNPIGPAALVSTGQSANLLTNPGFESGITAWRLNVTNDGQAQATATGDSGIVADGNSSAHIAVATADTVNWHVTFEQDNLPLTAGASYQVQFWARANSPRTIAVMTQGGAPNYANYGLFSQIAISASWSLYSASFIAPATAADGRLEFWFGDVVGDVWLDDVNLSAAPAAVYRRDFTNGAVLLNGAASAQTISNLTGLQRFSGAQAPRYQYIVDDADAGFSATGDWNTVAYNTGAFEGGFGQNLPSEPQNANGPYYHCWQGSCHELDSGSGEAQWNLSLPADGTYTIQVWLPAAPNAGNWTKNAVYEIISNGNVVFSATLDQTTASAGDGWRTIATGLSLATAGTPVVRVHNGGTGALIADAVYVTSTALYNDGSPAPQVTLAPFDAILLQRQKPVPSPASRVNSVVNAASYQPAITSGGFFSILGTGFASSSRSWSSSDFSNGNLPVSLEGVSVTVNGQSAYVEYISPTQVNAIAPDDDTIGQVQVQVTTPQGESYAGTVLKQKLSPAFFTYRSGTTSYAAAVHLDGTLVGPPGASSRPAAPGEVIEIYGTGFGATAPTSPSAQLVSQPATTALPATMTVGGIAADVQWAGLVLSGLYQLNVKIPTLAPGDQPVQASISGFQSPANVMLSIANH